jgi:ABC-2 type transport system ATP-binding protein
MLAIELQNICKSLHATPIIDHLSLQIEAGEMLGLLGPAGAGKTTLLNMMSGLIAPDSGTLEIMGYRLPREAGNVQRILGVVPQDTALYADLTAWDNLAVFADFSGIPQSKKHVHIRDVLTRMQLLKYGSSRVSSFSAQMKRRLALGCALLTDPPLLYLDELTASIDVQERFALWDYVHSLRPLHKTCVLATSSFEEACTLCDRIALIVAGKLLTIGVPEQFKQWYGDIVIEMELSRPFTSFMELNALQGVKKCSPPSGVGAAPRVRPPPCVPPPTNADLLSIIVINDKLLPQIIALVAQECEIKELRVRAVRLTEILAHPHTEEDK